jgi:hypothetical protein
LVVEFLYLQSKLSYPTEHEALLAIQAPDKSEIKGTRIPLSVCIRTQSYG